MSVIKFGTWQDLSGNEVANSTDPVGDGGLVHIKSQNIGSGVSSVTVANAFNSSYDNYYVIIAGADSSASVANCVVSLAGKTSGYYGSGTRTYYTNTTTVSIMDRNNGSNWYAGEFVNNAAGHKTLTICNPYTTSYPVSFQAQGWGGGYATFFMGDGGSATTSYTDLVIGPSTGTITGGTIRVYGYRN